MKTKSGLTNSPRMLSTAPAFLLSLTGGCVASDARTCDKAFAKSDKVTYGTAGGHHPRSHGAFTKTSDMAFMHFPLVNTIDTISPRPILFIVDGATPEN